MSDFSGIEKFDQCQRKGYNSCPYHNDPIMKKAIVEDIPENETPIILRAPSPEDIEEATRLCESCDLFRA